MSIGRTGHDVALVPPSTKHSLEISQAVFAHSRKCLLCKPVWRTGSASPPLSDHVVLLIITSGGATAPQERLQIAMKAWQGKARL